MRVLLVPGPAIASHVPELLSELSAGGATVQMETRESFGTADVSHCDVIAGPGNLRCDATLFDRSPRLRGLVSIGIGCEGFDTGEACRRGIAVLTGRTAQNVEGMSSATVMLMLALAHDLPGAQSALQAGTTRDPGRATLLDRLTVGLIGFGAIGQDVARRLRAWQVQVQASSLSRTTGRDASGVEFTDLETLLATSDVISLHATLNSTTWHLLDRTRLGSCKPGTLIVNTARGGLIDEVALADMLVDGHIGGAALDCFEIEPLPGDSPLREAPNAMLTPHQVGHTGEGMQSITHQFVRNILSFVLPPQAQRPAR